MLTPRAMRSIVVGGAGFIGSHLVDELVLRGRVTVYDNFTVGKREFLADAMKSGNVDIVEGDALDLEKLTASMQGHDAVFHLAANPEARWGLERTRLDLEQGTIATYNSLEAARLSGVPRFVLSSSGTVYGNVTKSCAEGDLGALPFSLYGASKIAGESLVASYVECFGLRGTILRFGNVVGPRGTHGAILDFCKKLKAHPEFLDVLGNGSQTKPYLHVTDCVGGVLHVFDHAAEPLAVYNLAPPDWTSVTRIAELCVQYSPNPSARIEFGEGTQGWKGDVPTSRLDASKLNALGYKLKNTSDRAVELGVQGVSKEVFS